MPSYDRMSIFGTPAYHLTGDFMQINANNKCFLFLFCFWLIIKTFTRSQCLIRALSFFHSLPTVRSADNISHSLCYNPIKLQTYLMVRGGHC